jgi:hypothetical protein
MESFDRINLLAKNKNRSFSSEKAPDGHNSAAHCGRKHGFVKAGFFAVLPDDPGPGLLA